MGARRRLASASLTTLVELARQRDEDAWCELVARFERLVWKAVNVVTRDDQVRRDAFGATWLRLAENLGSIRDPERLAGWLAVTATREAIAASRSEQRFRGGADYADTDLGDGAERPPAELVTEHESVVIVRRALTQLGEPCRELLTALLVCDPPLSYAEIAVHFGRSQGWIGPTRERCLAKLRRVPEVAALVRGEAA